MERIVALDWEKRSSRGTIAGYSDLIVPTNNILLKRAVLYFHFGPRVAKQVGTYIAQGNGIPRPRIEGKIAQNFQASPAASVSYE